MPNRITQLPEWLVASLSNVDEVLPPGQRETDWLLPQLPTTQVFDPAEHPGPSRLRDVEDLFDPLVLNDDDQPWPGLPVGGEALDTLAWYKSFRQGPSWGIYIREAAVLSLSRWLGSVRRPAGPDSQRVAWTKFYLHEYAHFLFDVAARSLEEIVQADLYEPYRLEVTHTSPGWHMEAEALCNAFAYRTTPATGYQAKLRSFMQNQPRGYCDFTDYVLNPDFDRGVEIVLGHMMRGLTGPPGFGTRALFGDSETGGIAPAMVPVYVVHESDDPPLFQLITSLATVESSKTFNKDFRALPMAVRTAWVERVLPSLHTDVRTAGHFKKLHGRDDLFSVRVHGEYRAILQREGGGKWTVLNIRHRREVYR